MRKIVILALSALLLLSSCMTNVSVEYMQPSEINMGPYRNIAVASTVPYRAFQSPPIFVRGLDAAAERNTFVTSSYDRSLAAYAANYATDKLIDTLTSSGFFSVTPPAVTDVIIDYANLGNNVASELEKRGIDAVIIPRITAMGADEYISSEEYYVNDPVRKDQSGNPLKVKAYRYYLNESAYIDYSYTIIDAATMQVYAVRHFSDSRESQSRISENGMYSGNVRGFFTSMINSFQKYILRQLVPQRRSATLSLMSNKPKIESLKTAYEYAKSGNEAEAERLFLTEYNTSGHIPSGYNAALLMASLGDVDKAIELLEQMSSTTDSKEVASLLAGMKDMRNRSEEAMKQINGAEEGETPQQNKNIFQVVMGV